MSELRNKVVEAMAQAIPQPGQCSCHNSASLASAAAALDAALDVLGDAGDNWPYLLTLLRAGKGSNE